MKKYSDIYKNILGKLPGLKKDIANSLLVHSISLRLVENDTPEIVQDLQRKGIKVIAFTATLTGNLSCSHDKTIVLRTLQLQKNGFEFMKSFQDSLECLSFTEFPRYAGSYPMFYKGVLSSNGEEKVSKGQTLVAFLAYMGKEYQLETGSPGYYPKVVILIDDRKKHLIDVEENLKTYNPAIQFIGIEYQGAFSYAPQDISKESFQQFWEDMVEKAKAEISEREDFKTTLLGL